MNSSVPLQRNAQDTTPPKVTWLCNLVEILPGGDINVDGDEWQRLTPAERDDLLGRQVAQQELIRQMMVCARNYKEKALRSMLLANQARKDYLEVHDTDAGLGDLPLWKGHVNDNRWYMEWSRVYDGHAQMEMKAYELGMY